MDEETKRGAPTTLVDAKASFDARQAILAEWEIVAPTVCGKLPGVIQEALERAMTCTRDGYSVRARGALMQLTMDLAHLESELVRLDVDRLRRENERLVHRRQLKSEEKIELEIKKLRFEVEDMKHAATVFAERPPRGTR